MIRGRVEERVMEEPKWVGRYLQDLASKSVPKDWADAARYYLKDIHWKKVTDVRIRKWVPESYDAEYRVITKADVWCSAKVAGETVGVLVSMKGNTELSFFPEVPGTSK